MKEELEILMRCSEIKSQLDSLVIVPTARISKKKRIAIDKTNLLVLSFVGKWLERRLKRFENEERLPNAESGAIIHIVMEHIIINDHAVGFKSDCEEDHDDI